ncbi:MAG TPA: 23S rRNA (adenine(2503)-C(2))-methyltransferase RlmN [Candidatus Binatia bacterium]|nr:23S rRNA (adenine(2503)-C(2))-methyltransferase RlmN [Candidatus Binatia bacterium]
MTLLQHRELLNLTNQRLSEILEDLGQPGYRLQQVLDGLYRQRWTTLDQFTMLPKSFRDKLLEEGYLVGQPVIAKRFVSCDGTVRYLFQFSDSQSVETVWMPEGDGGEAGDGSDNGDEELANILSGRVILSEATEGSGAEGLPREIRTRRQRATICVSSQVGCAVDCKFCMTALLGLHRNLNAGEIIGQVLAVLNDQQVDIDRDRINLVFMGQGEPFLNYDNFMQAVRMLVTGAGVPASRMTVSTSGIVPRIADFGAEDIRPKLAVSLNASNEARRTEIMPITKKWTIAKLLAALRDFPLRNRERLTFEYVLLGGVNDDPSQAREVVDLIRGLRAKVNLIALNPGPEIPYAMPDPERVLAFQSILIAAGIPTFIRLPRGRDIYAACGQLKHTTELLQLT